MRHTATVSLALAIALPCSVAIGQRLAVYDPIASTIGELRPPTAVLPPPTPPLVVYPTAPVLPPPPAMLPMPGDSTFDNLAGLHWFTNGLVLAAMPTPAWPPLAPVPPPIPIPPPVLGAIGGPVTGIAIDPAAGTMFLCSIPGIVVGVAPVPGLPIVVPPFPIPTGPGPVAGLEWDGATGTLWAIDIGFAAHNFFPGGLPAAPPILPFGPLPGPPGDIAIDKIGTVNPAGLRPLYITGGGLCVDMRDPAAVVWPVGPPAQGLAFMNHPAVEPPLPGCEGCPGAYPGPTAFTTSVSTTGNAAFAVGSGGLLPGLGFVIFAFDTVAAPFPFPPINGPAACPLGLTLSPTLLLVLGGPAGLGGTILLPMPLGGVPIGAQLHNQNFTFCGAQPSGFAFSRFQTITVGGL